MGIVPLRNTVTNSDTQGNTIPFKAEVYVCLISVGLGRSWILTSNDKSHASLCMKILHITQGQCLECSD